MKKINQNIRYRSEVMRATFILLAVAACAAMGDNSLSGMPGAFAPVDLGGKSYALAGAQTADPAASEVLLHNPSAMYDAGWSSGYSFSNSFSLLNYNFASASYRLKSSPWAFGAGMIQNGDDVYSENEVFLGSAAAWHNWRAGFTWKLRYASTGNGGEDFISPDNGRNTKVSGTGMGFSGFDIGLRAIFFEGKLILGGVMKDAFSAVAWNTKNDAGTADGEYVEFVPLSVKIGGQVRMSPDFTLSADYEPGVYNLPPPFDLAFLKTYEDIKNRLLIGLEWLPLYRFSTSEMVRNLLAFRGGYAETVFEKDKSKAFAMGGGLAFPIGLGGARVSIDGGYQINTIFEGHNSFRAGISVYAK